MFGIHKTPHASELRDERFASEAEFEGEFDSQAVSLQWLAEVITGDAQVARQCVTDARTLSSKNSQVFRDWLSHWARTATVRKAIDAVRAELAAASLTYQASVEHGAHEPLATEDMRLLQTLDATQIAAALDPLARATLVLRGIQRATLQECALTFGVSRVVVLAAMCKAVTWVRSLESDFLHTAKRGAAAPRCSTAHTPQRSERR